MKNTILFLLFLLIPWRLLAQPPRVLRQIDSLQNLLKNSNDTTQVLLLLEISRRKPNYNYAAARSHAEAALKQAKTISYKNGLSLSYSLLGIYEVHFAGDLEKAEVYFDSARSTNPPPYILRDVYSNLAMMHFVRGALDKSYSVLSEALKANGSLEDNITAQINTQLAITLGEIKRNAEAVPYFKRGIEIYERTGKVGAQAATMNNLAVVYLEMDHLDSALYLYKELYKIELKYGNPKSNIGLLSNLGKLYLKMGNRDTAYYFLHAGLKESKAQYTEARVTILFALGEYHLLVNQADSALFYGRQVLKQIHDNSPLLLEQAHYILAEAHGRMGSDSAYYFFKQYLLYHDSIFQENKTQQIAALEAAFDLERKEKKIHDLQEAHRNGIFRRNALIAGLCLSILISVLAYYSLRAKIRIRKKELEQKNRELEYFTIAMIEKSELVEELRAQIDQFKSEVNVSKDRIENLSQVLNSSLLTEDDWEKFKALFEQVYPDFFAGLKIKYPGLTSAETRLSALLKLNLTSREIASMLGISIESANTARYRLRKKLELHPEEDLSEVISNVTG